MAQFVPRRQPAKGVLIDRGKATIVFVTVCALQRAQRLASDDVHHALLRAWRDADAWIIGSYVIMPDHLHFFCSPIEEEVRIEQWITFWKRRFRTHVGANALRFQSGAFHHRLRQDESYSEKWEYVRANPVRARLVLAPDDWPFHGVINELRM